MTLKNDNFLLCLLVMLMAFTLVTGESYGADPLSIDRVVNQVLREGIMYPLENEAFVFFDDFQEFDSNGANDAGWIETSVGTSPVKLFDEQYGVLEIVSGATENNGANIQWNAEQFYLGSEKTIEFETRLKSVEDVEVDIFAGLIITDTTVIDSTEPSDGIYFAKNDGDSLITAVMRLNTSNVKIDTLGVISDNTWVNLKMIIENRVAKYYVDDAFIAQTALSDTTSLPEDEALAVTLAMETGAAAAESLYVDYVKAKQDR